MSITLRATRALFLALILTFAVGLMVAASSVVDAHPALADDADDGGDDDDGDDGGDAGGRGGDDDGRGGDDDGRGDDDRGGDDDADDRGGDDRVVPVGGVQTGAGGMSTGGELTLWLVGGGGLLAGASALVSRLRSGTGDSDA